MGNQPGSMIRRPTRKTTIRRSSSKSMPSTEWVPSNTTANLETFLLVWLDPHVNSSKENVQTQRRLRKVLTCLVTFDKVDDCEKWLKKIISDEKIIFIVSGAYGKEIVPRIHHISTIVMIYVYCLDVERNKAWAKNYPKIRSVQSVTSKLIQDLSSNQINLESVEDSKALNVYKCEQQPKSPDPSTTTIIWFQLLLEILVSPMYFQSTPTSDSLVRILRQYSYDDEYALKLIDEFAKTYEPKKALTWLMGDVPSARVINKALREQDIEIMFAFRFLLVDIRAQIVERQVTSPLNVFKIQLMTRSAMENLKANPGHLMVTNGFLFASTSVPLLETAVTNQDLFEPVVLNIRAHFDPDAAPFAFLDEIEPSLTKQTDREVIFMCGSMFEVGSLICENAVWTLHLTLAGSKKSQALLTMTQKLRENHNMCVVGDIFWRVDETEKATIYYRALLNELPLRHNLISEINSKLIKLSSQDSASADQILYILVNLADHMSEFSLSVLRVLRLMTPELILTVDSDSRVDFSQWSKHTTSIFTTVQNAPSCDDISKHCRIFLLDRGNNNVDQRRFASIDDLICQLAEEIIQPYRSNDNQCADDKDATQTAERNAYVNQIYAELRKIQPRSKITVSSTETTETPPTPSLVWLMKDINSVVVSDDIERTFKEYFSSFLTYFREDEFHYHLMTEDMLIDAVVIIDNDYPESIAKNLQDFPRIQHVYYHSLLNKKDLDDLHYRLTYDLIDYYGKLAEQYRTEKQRKKARHVSLQAKKLCQLLSETCFSEK